MSSNADTIDMTGTLEVCMLFEELDGHINGQDAGDRAVLYQAKERIRMLLISIDRARSGWRSLARVDAPLSSGGALLTGAQLSGQAPIDGRRTDRSEAHLADPLSQRKPGAETELPPSQEAEGTAQEGSPVGAQQRRTARPNGSGEIVTPLGEPPVDASDSALAGAT